MMRFFVVFSILNVAHLMGVLSWRSDRRGTSFICRLLTLSALSETYRFLRDGCYFLGDPCNLDRHNRPYKLYKVRIIHFLVGASYRARGLYWVYLFLYSLPCISASLSSLLIEAGKSKRLTLLRRARYLGSLSGRPRINQAKRRRTPYRAQYG